MSSIEKPIDTKEAAIFLHISEETLRRKAQSGEIPASKSGKGWIYVKEDLIKYIRSLYHGKSIIYAAQDNLKEGDKCQFTNDIAKRSQKNMYGGPTLRRKVEKEYDNLLGQKTEQKHNNYTTN